MKYASLQNAFVIAAVGPDAERYLHARTTQNIKSLEVGQSTLAAVLDAQGKTGGVFTVYRDKPEEFFLIADGGDQAEVLAALLKFKVADRIDVSILPNYAIYYFYEKEEAVRAKTEELSKHCHIFSEPTGEKQLSLDGGTFLLTQSKELTANFGKELSNEETTALRIAGGRPLFDKEISPQRVFLESGLTDAISRTKGCYAGQEVIEKISSRGKAPRTLSSFTVKGAAPDEGEAVLLVEANREPTKVGEVITAAKKHSQEEASSDNDISALFALLKTDAIRQKLTLKDGRELIL